MRSGSSTLRAGAILFGLVAATILATSMLGSLSLPQPIRVIQRPPPTVLDGVLFMQTLIGIRPLNSAPSFALMYYRDLASERVTITRIDDPLFAIHVVTNFTGLIILNLPPSDGYELQINESRFDVTIRFSIQAAKQTTILLTVERVSYPTVFSEGQDTLSSGWITPGSRLSLSIESDVRLPQNSHPFYLATESRSGLTRTYDNLTRDLSIRETPLNVLSQDTRHGILWIEASALGPLPGGNVIRLSLVRYSPSYTVDGKSPSTVSG
jgi:hypothetical protein